jgi:TRAP-type C4-dicarboxylate transport system substrate-binding protein
MSGATALDKEITQYLSHLNVKQKKTVLTVVKTLVDEQNDWWDEISKEQQQAIDKALLEMKSGKIMLSKKSNKNNPKKKSIYDFVGILTKKQTGEMKKVIKETAEKTHSDDWK